MRACVIVVVAMSVLGVSCQQNAELVEKAKAEPVLYSDLMKALDAKLEFPSGVVIGSDGRIFVAEREGSRVRAIDPKKGEIATIVGLGVSGYNGDGFPAIEALIGAPESLALDSSGNLYIGERGAFRVRRIDMKTGIISTYAGNGERGFEGDGGPATEARISHPYGLTFDAEDNLLIADTENQKIRRVDAATGIITTVAGTGERGYGGDGGDPLDAKLSRPHVLVFDPMGRLVIGDSFNQRIRRIDPETGTIDTIAGTGEIGSPVVGANAAESPFIFFGALVFDEDGDLLVTSLDNRIVKIDAESWTIESIAGIGEEAFGGDGGPASEAAMYLPYGMALDTDGNIYFADGKNDRVRRIVKATGIIETVAGGGEVAGIVVKPPEEEE